MLLTLSLYIFEKNLLVNKYKMGCKKNENLFFWHHENGQIFPSKVCDFQYDNKFPFSRKMENIKGSKEVRLLKLRNLN